MTGTDMNASRLSSRAAKAQSRPNTIDMDSPLITSTTGTSTLPYYVLPSSAISDGDASVNAYDTIAIEYDSGDEEEPENGPATIAHLQCARPSYLTASPERLANAKFSIALSLQQGVDGDTPDLRAEDALSRLKESRQKFENGDLQRFTPKAKITSKNLAYARLVDELVEAGIWPWDCIAGVLDPELWGGDLIRWALMYLPNEVVTEYYFRITKSPESQDSYASKITKRLSAALAVSAGLPPSGHTTDPAYKRARAEHNVARRYNGVPARDD